MLMSLRENTHSTSIACTLTAKGKGELNANQVGTTPLLLLIEFSVMQEIIGLGLAAGTVPTQMYFVSS
jgi:hypothetical protein